MEKCRNAFSSDENERERRFFFGMGNVVSDARFVRLMLSFKRECKNVCSDK